MSSRRPKARKIVFVTSLRDTLVDDGNGKVIDTRWGPSYMRGAIEHTVLECRPGGRLYGLYEVAAVINDDTERDAKQNGFVATPKLGKEWLHPLDLKDHHGNLILGKTWNIPSNFRYIRHNQPEYPQHRPEAKRAFELKVMKVVQHVEGDLIISDHLMLLIAHLHKWMPGRVLNIHPAVTALDHPHCFRGKTPTADALARAKLGIETYTGATLHYVDDEIDNGAIIHCNAPTLVDPCYEPHELRLLNYRYAKLPVLTEGLDMLAVQGSLEQVA